MKTIRFNTRISNEGTIQIPQNSALLNKEVEVIIFPHTKNEKRTLKAHQFAEKWAGFLNSLESDNSRYEYLMKKYK